MTFSNYLRLISIVKDNETQNLLWCESYIAKKIGIRKEKIVGQKKLLGLTRSFFILYQAYTKKSNQICIVK